MDDKPLGDQFPVIGGKTMGFEERKMRHSWSGGQLLATKPWGSYTDYYRTESAVFKTITVKPHARLSLQSHDGRNELWFVLEGECVCELEDNEIELNEGDSIIIPRKSKHRLSNRSAKACIVAEMQYGVCSEDDLIRYEDDYNRE